MGHGIAHKMVIEEDSTTDSVSPACRFSRRQNILIGLATIFGLTGITAFAATFRETKGS
jgi:hypothetical protein